MNPFELSSKSPESLILNWQQMTGVPYDKNAVDPYTRCRVILMNGTEFEAVWYSHQFSRHCSAPPGAAAAKAGGQPQARGRGDSCAHHRL